MFKSLERWRELEPGRAHPDRRRGSGVDHFIPRLAVDPATSGASAHLALTYCFYTNAACTQLAYRPSSRSASSSLRQLRCGDDAHRRILAVLVWLSRQRQGESIGM